jgi:hypothetical protein
VNTKIFSMITIGTAIEENELSKTAIGLAIEVHKALGPGLLENSYQQCLSYKLKKAGLVVEARNLCPWPSRKSGWKVVIELSCL